jgi:hypothetical protein
VVEPVIPQLDLDSEIVPAHGLGGFEVGRALSDYEELLRSGYVFDRVVPRIHGFWQVVYRISQIYEVTPEESAHYYAAHAEWSELRRAGKDADLESVVEIIKPPDEPPAIDLWVDARDGLIDAVTALDAYAGGFRALRVGMTYAESREVESNIVPHAFLDDTTIDGVQGLVLCYEPADPNPGHEGEARLDGITVFDPTRSDQGIKPY